MRPGESARSHNEEGSMSRKWLPLALAVCGAGLLILATTASAAPKHVSHVGKTGGTLKVEYNSDVDYVDPALDYLDLGWNIQQIVGCKLLNYPDKNGDPGLQLVPEVAASQPVISSNGKVYTFTVRSGFKFANGEAVTAKSFVNTFNRNANPKLQSPAAAFLNDIVGAQAVLDGKASSISGIKVSGNKLTFTLTKSAPDFLARLAMPFFAAVPNSFASKLDPNGENVIPGCGPYWISGRVPNQSITVKRNPFYKGDRPHNVNEIDYKIGNSIQVIEQDVLSGAADLAYEAPPNDWKGLVDKYGVNKSQVWIKPQLSVSYWALNRDRPLFKNNPKLAQAINNALDRRALLSQAGFAAGVKFDHILPPGVPGYQKASIYPLKGADIKKAKSLASGNTRDGKATVWVRNTGVGPLQAQIVQFDLAQIGIKADIQQLNGAVYYTKAGVRGADFDIIRAGWIADYPDPYDFINVLLDGGLIQDSNNVNLAYYNNPKYNKEMAAAARLVGAPRYKTYGSLDIDMMTNDPPWVVQYATSNRMLTSKRVGCFTYGPYYIDLNAICLK
jgi:ABC-type oligopeptide transport system substrate-binding subunit